MGPVVSVPSAFKVLVLNELQIYRIVCGGGNWPHGCNNS